MALTRIAVATVRPLPEPDPDEPLLLAALRQAGADARMWDWHDDSVDPASFDLVVIRSTWDSHRAPDGFRAWVRRTAAATRLVNPADAVLWNLHKGYLRELEARGVPIVPTAWVAKGERADAAALLARFGGRIVAKPAISAASFRTERFAAGEAAAAQRFLDDLASGGDAMVQPYLASTETTGERSLMVIDGAVTHAIRKTPRFAGGDESVSAALAPTAEEAAFAERTVAAAGFADLAYARVDVMRDDAGRLVLSELELIEPSLFLEQHPPALDRLVRALVREGGPRPGPAPHANR